MNQLSMDFSGKTYDHNRDSKRLSKQLLVVLDFMTDFPGWHTLREISEHTRAPEASVSARLRDIDKLPGFAKERRYDQNGLHEYRVVRRQ